MKIDNNSIVAKYGMTKIFLMDLKLKYYSYVDPQYAKNNFIFYF